MTATEPGGSRPSGRGGAHHHGSRIHRPTSLPHLPRRRRNLRWQRMPKLRRAYGSAIVWSRWIIVALWIAAVAATLFYLPSLTSVNGGGFGGFTKSNSEAIHAEIDSVHLFKFPVITRVLVVQYNKAGFTVAQQRHIVQRALDIDQHKATYADLGTNAYAVPLINLGGATGQLGHGKPDTVAVTIFGFPPSVPFDKQVTLAHSFIANHTTAQDHVVGVTGLFAGRVRQLHYLHSNLTLLEIVTVAAVLVVVGLRFRSLVAPLVTALAAGASYALVMHVTAWVTQISGTSIPSDLEPLIVALLLGVATDYSIFFLNGMQDRLGHGDARLAAARVSTAEYTPIVATAGLTVSSTVLALLAAKLQLFRTFGPGLAITVAITAAVCVTLVPALLAILGRATFWPSHPKPLVSVEAESGFGTGAELDPKTLHWRGRLARTLTVKPVAVLVILACVGAAYVATMPIRHMHLELGVTSSLPHDDEVQQAAAALSRGFPAGLLSPTVIVVKGTNLVQKQQQLASLEQQLKKIPGVNGVIGPGDRAFAAQQLGAAAQGGTLPGQAAGQLPSGRLPSGQGAGQGAGQGKQAYGAVLRADGTAARYVVLFGSYPTSWSAVAALQRIEKRMPALLRQDRLTGLTVEYAGDTKLSQEATNATTSSLYQIAIVAFGIDFLLLALFLRALVAPIYLLATNTMAMVMALGVTTYIFQDVVGYDGLVFYVPFAAFVLLLALGSDYNIFSVGSIWEEAAGRNLRDAVTIAVPRSTSAITAAGVALATSFGLLAIVPISPLQELGVVLSLGILFDAFIVRSLLVPALLAVFGRASGWPGKQLKRGEGQPRDPSTEAVPTA